jgi:hypothetical protein
MVFASWGLVAARAVAAEASAASGGRERIELNLRQEKWTGDLDGMIAPRPIRVIVPYSKTAYWVDLGRPRGLLYAGGLTITDERSNKVDFSDPTVTDVQEIVGTGPQSPSVATVDDLAVHEIFVRRSSSYFEHLTALNAARTKTASRPSSFARCPGAPPEPQIVSFLIGSVGGAIAADIP